MEMSSTLHTPADLPPSNQPAVPSKLSGYHNLADSSVVQAAS
jgi:hypothetical protein